MNISEFIVVYKNQDIEKMNEVKIAKYIPINKKESIIKNLILIFSSSMSGNINYIDIMKKKELARFFNILLSYTNITVNEYTEDLYDECMSCGIDKFIKHYCNTDYNRFCKLFDEAMQISDTMLFREAIINVGNSNLSEEFEKVVDGIKKNKKVFENLNDIIGFNNIGLRGTAK